ncbi:hypothetical protein [Lentilactobacillus sp. SPB1-3]|uniref:Uncharacterized protein n=1 Tax=Lentilactobacillus terminaliae TaxID=3003483 RepID=A0ACD5DCL6_9LACO|nr:hypothetical protein [Lentilactobacillus sp. SPB1-3]MCZ0978083.1 hypothetical protein [Lentilactobacillus sp. SPB1-3]
MQGKIYSSGKEILMNFSQSLTLPATVDNSAATVNDEGRKIIKAGTPLGAAKDFRLNKGVVLTPTTDATAVQVVAMHDIDITNGQAAATVIKRGDVVYKNMDKDVRALFTADIQKALTHIILV